MAVRLIDTPAGFAALMREVDGVGVVALDTEAASFHRFFDRVYLIQISTPTLTAVIDPLAVGDLAPIGALLNDARIEKVFHDADYDLRLFEKQFGFHCENLFDTRVAAQFLNEPGIGLAALLQKYVGIAADKRFQRADWSARPLTRPMLDYAAGDTAYLHQLRDILMQQLRAAGRLEWVREECQRSTTVRWSDDADPATDYLRIKGARALDRRALALLRELHQWRDQLSRSLDRASFRILGNEPMFELAQHPPRDIDGLAKVKGVGRDLAERRASELLAAIERGLAIPDPDLPRLERSPRRVSDPAYDARLEALKKERNAIAEQLQLAPGVTCPNGTLEVIARVEPSDTAALSAIIEMRHWQVTTFGDRLLAAMHAAVPPQGMP